MFSTFNFCLLTNDFRALKNIYPQTTHTRPATAQELFEFLIGPQLIKPELTYQCMLTTL